MDRSIAAEKLVAEPETVLAARVRPPQVLRMDVSSSSTTIGIRRWAT
ncbi:hypothetical protein [Nocardia abscessus]|nr:hypothetical protein [Nocardia abscessus]